MSDKVIYKDFTQPEIDFLLSMCNFSDLEKDVFLLRCKNVSIEQISYDLSISIATVNRNIIRIKNKIRRVL
jgi:DNA-directed RNA polymerase specialized sigma24 family protein